MHTIKNIIFDVGQVLFSYNPEWVIDAIYPDTPHRQFYLDQLFNNPLWEKMDRGDISKQKACQILQEKKQNQPEITEQANKMIIEFSDHLRLIPETKQLFTQFIQTHNVYILSNYQDKPFDRLIKNNPFMTQAKGIVVSAKINKSKPEPAIYQYLLNTYNLNPKESLFIDDRKENIQAAKDQNIKTIHYKNGLNLTKAIAIYRLT